MMKRKEKPPQLPFAGSLAWGIHISGGSYYAITSREKALPPPSLSVQRDSVYMYICVLHSFISHTFITLVC